ncbi:pentatricopeptide repeat-containing protein 1, mitochondrial-like [Sitodiplosis mosellana]|uniref:pentatricopeptide repeat-containing protein 1, mitochondrial-like n=1 Tax=Sitodiplosis mosellana TaxID=263140 RepID=UPI002443B827|nr:pentatricopeptide repeat-containing protein 1, mitochondrial-like [Sitodiplosis mosellana]
MWSRTMNRNLVQRSLVCFQNRNIHSSIVCHGYKHQTDKGAIKPNSKLRTDLNKNSDRFLYNPKNEIPLFGYDDPDKFGSLNRQVSEPEPDEGDIADDEHYRNIPLRRDQLSQKRYTDMVKRFIRDRRMKEAIDVLEVRMKEDRVKPDYYIYELLIMECGRLGYTKKAFKLYNLMKKRDLRINGQVYAALFSACANTIHPSVGLELAKNLRKSLIQNEYIPNEIIYNTMIKAFGRCGDIDTAFQLVDEMKDRKLLMKVHTMNHLLQACCSDKAYGFRHALIVWHKIYHHKMVPDIHSFNLMIRCTRDCGIGDTDEMRKVIANILQSSQAAVKLRSSKKQQVLFIEDKPKKAINAATNEGENSDLVEQSGLKNELASKSVCDQMPNLLTKLPHLGSVVKLSMVQTPEDRLMLLGGVKGIIDEFEETKVRPNVKTFSQLLYTIPSTREAEHDLIQQMRYMRVRADIDLFNLLIKRRILRNDYDGAKQVLNMIAKVNLIPDIVTYGVLAIGCKTREQAQEFRERLDEKGIRLNNEILGALLKNATFIKDYDYVNDVLEYAMIENIKPSLRFTEILGTFKNGRYYKLQNNDNNEELAKYNAFYKVYKKWKSQMELTGLSTDEVKKLLYVHPWGQLKEAEGEGIEDVKNINTRRLWKRQRVLKKLNSSCIEKIHSQNKTHENSERKEPTENPEQTNKK